MRVRRLHLGNNITRCPTCGAECVTIRSDQIAATYREITYKCTDPECEHLFVASVVPVRVIAESKRGDGGQAITAPERRQLAAPMRMLPGLPDLAGGQGGAPQWRYAALVVGLDGQMAEIGPMADLDALKLAVREVRVGRSMRLDDEQSYIAALRGCAGGMDAKTLLRHPESLRLTIPPP